jgi:teichuronic acid biosynthesis glycosyltransferase TuaG
VDYEYALRHTIISTITVMFDRNQIPEEVLYMPLDARGEDTATWWKILRHGYIAYGINEPLSVYRRHEGSRSSNKIDAVYGTWKMYRQNEKLGLVKSMRCFLSYVCNAIKRRI